MPRSALPGGRRSSQHSGLPFTHPNSTCALVSRKRRGGRTSSSRCAMETQTGCETTLRTWTTRAFRNFITHIAQPRRGALFGYTDCESTAALLYAQCHRIKRGEMSTGELTLPRRPRCLRRTREHTARPMPPAEEADAHRASALTEERGLHRHIRPAGPQVSSLTCTDWVLGSASMAIIHNVVATPADA